MLLCYFKLANYICLFILTKIYFYFIRNSIRFPRVLFTTSGPPAVSASSSTSINTSNRGCLLAAAFKLRTNKCSYRLFLLTAPASMCHACHNPFEASSYGACAICSQCLINSIICMRTAQHGAAQFSATFPRCLISSKADAQANCLHSHIGAFTCVCLCICVCGDFEVVNGHAWKIP